MRFWLISEVSPKRRVQYNLQLYLRMVFVLTKHHIHVWH